MAIESLFTTCMCVYVHMYLCWLAVDVCVSFCMYVCVCLCVYVLVSSGPDQHRPVPSVSWGGGGAAAEGHVQVPCLVQWQQESTQEDEGQQRTAYLLYFTFNFLFRIKTSHMLHVCFCVLFGVTLRLATRTKRELFVDNCWCGFFCSLPNVVSVVTVKALMRTDFNF